MSADETTAMAKTPETHAALTARAQAAARAYKSGDTLLSWTEALETAPWPKSGHPAFERDFRSAFARELVKLGVAKEPARSGSAPKKGGQTKLMRRLLSATEEEFAEHDRRAKAAGLSWSSWARRKLAE